MLHRRTSGNADQLEPIESELRASIAADQPEGRKTGVEHEFRVSDRHGPIDFRTIIGHLPIDGLTIVPDDPLAYRCRGGGLLTADGAEAEIATPPVPLRGGFSHELERLCRSAHRQLAGHLGPALWLDGWSTHINVEVADHLALPVAALMATRFAPALMLMMDRVDSPGLLVRPRPSRLELGGEYVAGEQLRAATVMAAGAVLACAAALASRPDRRHLPPALRSVVVPARARFGFYVDRSAFGTDLYEQARGAPLRHRWRRSTTAQVHLEACWASAKEALGALARTDELELVDAVVRGERPLPLEQPAEVSPCGATARPPAGTDPLDREVRPGFVVEPVLATWSFILYRLVGARTLYLCVPARCVAASRVALHSGRLDGPLRRALAAEPGERLLRSMAQTDEIGLFDLVGDPGGLTPSERDPATGQPFDGGGGAGRRAKQRSATPAPSAPVHQPRGRRRLVAIGAIGAIVGLVVVAASAAALVVASRSSTAEDHAVATPIVPTTVSTSTTSTVPATTLPVGPFRPTPAQIRAIQLSGTFDLVRRVVASNNGTAPVGTIERRVWEVSGACSGPPCEYTVSSMDPAATGPPGKFLLPFDGSTFVIDVTSVGDCFDNGTLTITVKGGADTTYRGALHVVEAEWQDSVLVATKLTGQAVLSGQVNAVGKASGCANAENRPVTYSVEANRRP